MKEEIKNVAASVRARLLNRARQGGRPFNELLQYYAIERFLYRVSISPYTDRFILKGSLMLHAWDPGLARATRDVDFLGKEKASVESVRAHMGTCLRLEAPADGLSFDAESLRTKEIRIGSRLGGVRLRFEASIGSARLPMQVDVGFGEVVVPPPQPVVYPSLLDLAEPHLWGYSRETFVAEKLHAMVVLDRVNTRLKDFYDVWLLCQKYDFEGDLLVAAIRTTFDQNATPYPSEVPFAFTDDFSGDPSKQAQWNAFLRKVLGERRHPALAMVVSTIHNFLAPPLAAASEARHELVFWPARGPWSSDPLVIPE